jgi:2,3-bisphosphoglycerate-dependent phosphoglycerate mutase
MGVVLHVGARDYEIGTASFLTSWFSTIYVRLESEAWGARFPTIMNELYAGRLPASQVATALIELRDIRGEFVHISPDALVWDYEDRAKAPPWGGNIAPTIRSLADAFVTSDGKNLFDVLSVALEDARRVGKDVEVG